MVPSPPYELPDPLYIVEESYFRYNSIKGNFFYSLTASSFSVRAEILAVISGRSRIFRSFVGYDDNVSSKSFGTRTDSEIMASIFSKTSVLSPSSSPVGLGVNLQSFIVMSRAWLTISEARMHHKLDFDRIHSYWWSCRRSVHQIFNSWHMFGNVYSKKKKKNVGFTRVSTIRIAATRLGNFYSKKKKKRWGREMIFFSCFVKKWYLFSSFQNTCVIP